MGDSRADRRASHENGKERAPEIYSHAMSLIENDLHNIIKTKSPFDKQTMQIRTSIRDNLAQLLLIDYEFCSAQDVEQTLWKVAFYKVIEEYRRRLRKYSGAADRAKQEELHKITTSFRKFLASGSQFYLSLLERLRGRYGDEDVKGIVSRHRCYIFLGDLARYHKDLIAAENEINAGKFENFTGALPAASKELSLAEAYYRQAIALLPINGNPHNQIAVLCTYRDDELGAVYSYCRSLAVRHPFTAARENLLLLFDKNRKRAQELRRPRAGRNTAAGAQSLRDFVCRFLRLHAVLFMRIGLDAFAPLLNEAARDLARQVLRHAGDPVVIKLFAINMFSIFNAQTTTEPLENRALIVKYAFSVAAEFFSTVAFRVKPNKIRFLAPLTIFMDWLVCNPEFLRLPMGPVELELKAWDAMRKGLVNVLNAVTHMQGDDRPNGHVTEGVVLPEEIELRGFLPLHDYLATVPFRPTLEQNPEHQDAWMARRIEKIKMFGQFLAMHAPGFLYFDPIEQIYTTVPPRGGPEMGIPRPSPSDVGQGSHHSPSSPQYDFTDDEDDVDDADDLPIAPPAPSASFSSNEGSASADDDIGDEVILFHRASSPSAAPTNQTLSAEDPTVTAEVKARTTAPIGSGRRQGGDAFPGSQTPPAAQGEHVPNMWLSHTLTAPASPSTPPKQDTLSLFTNFSFGNQSTSPAASAVPGLPSIWAPISSGPGAAWHPATSPGQPPVTSPGASVPNGTHAYAPSPANPWWDELRANPLPAPQPLPQPLPAVPPMRVDNTLTESFQNFSVSGTPHTYLPWLPQSFGSSPNASADPMASLMMNGYGAHPQPGPYPPHQAPPAGHTDAPGTAYAQFLRAQQATTHSPNG
eukprot:TRINITY_DN1531_c0_g1_i2.p1 TRINITY_DN1531_c0_g1~~TRINITY_DN1531_c0_g1_i2.p1  ORF type:complete len:865 (-),score=204.22 TRINITY_DN1531_c0_g1_i2:258-2852(-)